MGVREALAVGDGLGRHPQARDARQRSDSGRASAAEAGEAGRVGGLKKTPKGAVEGHPRTWRSTASPALSLLLGGLWRPGGCFLFGPLALPRRCRSSSAGDAGTVGKAWRK